jgi:hypothetical protein
VIRLDTEGGNLSFSDNNLQASAAFLLDLKFYVIR